MVPPAADTMQCKSLVLGALFPATPSQKKIDQPANNPPSILRSMPSLIEWINQSKCSMKGVTQRQIMSLGVRRREWSLSPAMTCVAEE
eukprot:767622-Ditylum_brightwellii.AAC.1